MCITMFSLAHCECKNTQCEKGTEKTREKYSNDNNTST